MNPKVDWYFTKAKKWRDEIVQLRTICIDSGLTEELKWGCPAYTHEGNNVVLIHAFKDYCALLFFKGVLMKDPKKLLIQQTASVQVARQIRFTSLQQIIKFQPTIAVYLKEAIRVEKSGEKAPLKKTSEFAVPEEFAKKLKAHPALKNAFKSLTPGRQRAYLLYFGSAKQAKTREERIEKYVKQILKGKGLDD